MSHLGDSNSGPMVYDTIALPTELRWRALILYDKHEICQRGGKMYGRDQFIAKKQ